MNNDKMLKKIKNYSKLEFIHKVSLVTSYVDEIIYNSIFLCFNTNEVEKAIENGAKTIIYEDKIQKISPVVNYVLVDDIRKAKAILYKEFYKNINKKLKIIGVIGTTGKSSTSRLICDFLNYQSKKALWIGTHEIIYLEEQFKTKNTTIDISLLYKHLVLATKRNYQYVVMEISSIGIAQLRVYGLELHRLVFTNFSEDHLDYHKTMEDYFYTKAILFYQNRNQVILNKDDPKFSLLNKYITCNYLTYSISKPADIYASDVLHDNAKLCFRIQDVIFKTNFFGHFFISNILAFLCCMESLGYPPIKSKDFLYEYIPLRGRMTCLKKGTNKIIIDYAHTPKSLETVLSFLRKATPNRLISVGGCGGDREEEKRMIMGNSLSIYSDKVILCDDNPRGEEPQRILSQMKGEHDFEIIHDRKVAIKKCFEELKEYDTLFIFGKGNEDSITYLDSSIPHNDITYIEMLLKG